MSANVLLTESLGVELHSDPWPEDVTLYQTFNVSTYQVSSPRLWHPFVFGKVIG